ncbi:MULTISPECIES: sigma D regulator [Halomonas]|uniref:Regulator of sigma D n=1 Tax=Halomonas ventosae TaxID=229007 RepID=A0A4R6H7E2_9GAMM|nr:sigma D regulator [Halomonas ventosae]TDO03491.1 regulator of sigma D [Halomonas ventosae]
MLEDCNNALERWGGVHELIDRWLHERRELLIQFATLKQTCDAELETVSPKRVDAFGERLMDYISAGHFEIYPQLREEAKAFGDHQALELAERLLERLEMSTELVLSFDRDYDSPARAQHHMRRLPAWLERLSRGLSKRFNLEDQLIARLHAAHSPAAARAEADTRA